MIYRQKNKKNKIKILIIVLISILFLFFFGGFIKNTVHFITNPILNINTSFSHSFSEIFSYFRSKNELQKINEELEKENQNLKIEVLTVDNLKKENESLKDLLNYIKPENNLISTKVITKPPFSPFDTFVVNNNNNQIKLEKNVFYKNLLIGKVIETYQNSAVIQLYSSSGQKKIVKINENEFEAEGIGNLSFKIKVPKSIEIKEETPVYSLKTNSIIGLVQNIKTEESSAFQDIYFKYPININEIDYVEIES